MKVLCITPTYWPAINTGGIARQCFDMNNELIKQGIDVTVYTTDMQTNAQPGLICGKEYVIEGVKTYYFRSIHLRGLMLSPSFRRTLARTIKAFDVVHVHGLWPYINYLALKYADRSSVPFIISPHGCLSNVTFRSNGRLKKLYYYWLMRRHIERSSAIIYDSDQELKQAEILYGLPIEKYVVYPGLDKNVFKTDSGRQETLSKYNIPDDKYVILFLGRLNWIKGVDLLIEAFGKINKTNKEAVLVLAGPASKGEKKRIDMLIRMLNISDKVICPGTISEEGKYNLLAHANMFVLPSHSESFGLAVVEAMAMGTPVIISNNVGMWRDVKNSKSGLVVGCAIGEIRAAIEEIMDDSISASLRANNAKKFVLDSCNLAKQTSKIAEIYSIIVSRKTAH